MPLASRAGVYRARVHNAGPACTRHVVTHAPRPSSRIARLTPRGPLLALLASVVHPEVLRKTLNCQLASPAPEVAVRRFLYGRGKCFRLCPSGVSGRTNLLNKSAGWALVAFVLSLAPLEYGP